MPRLAHPDIIKGHAVANLMDLYRGDPGFVEERERLRQPYLPLLGEWLEVVYAFWVDFGQIVSAKEYLREMFSAQEYRSIRDYCLGNSHVLSRGLRRKLDRRLGEIVDVNQRLKPYLIELKDLARRWKLRAPWAVQILFVYDLIDLLTAAGMPDKIDIPVEMLDSFMPFSPPYPPLKLEVSAWALILRGRREVQAELAKKLADYEGELKAAGLKEYPSALKAHAWWWFEHNVHGSSFDEIADKIDKLRQEPKAILAENIRKAIISFSERIGIEPE